MSYTVKNWQNCYEDSWKGIIIDEAMAHPAKYSRGLITRIIQYALEEGMIQPGQVVIDPFAGQGGGAWPCLQYGLHYIGVELEPRFVEFSRKNIALWNDRYSAHFPNWGTAQVLQGDSRRLASVIAGAGLVVGSPPYAGSFEGQTDKQTRAERESKAGKKLGGGQINHARDYGCSPGQLGAMKEGQISAVIGSPPFAGNTGGRGEASRNGIDAALFDRHSGGMKRGTGSDPANLDHLPQGEAPALIVGSPPYGDTFTKSKDEAANSGGRNGGSIPAREYGNTEGQLSQESPETFWAAAAVILGQCYQVLPVGGYAIWVTKRYVKNGKIVDFSGQWAALCEANGFEVVEWVRAWLVKDNGTQVDLFGEAHRKTVARKSFFRRLAEAKGSPPIDWEDVVITRKIAPGPSTSPSTSSGCNSGHGGADVSLESKSLLP